MDEITDQLLHALWQVSFFLPFAFKRNALTFWWSMHWFLPREFLDQRDWIWPLFPIGDGKMLDLIVFEIAAIIITVVYIKKASKCGSS